MGSFIDISPKQAAKWGVDIRKAMLIIGRLPGPQLPPDVHDKLKEAHRLMKESSSRLKQIYGR